MTAKDPHRHNFKKLGYIHEAGLAQGHEVNRIILTRTCACGKSQAFECGDKDAMRQLYAQLKQREGTHGNTTELLPAHEKPVDRNGTADSP